MLENTAIKTTTYNASCGFMVDIVCNNESRKREAYIYHKDCGIKDLMFGTSMEQDTYEEFFDMVEQNFTDYANDYMDEYYG